ncbi:MAG: prepilin-type N-terminal cleavage/methylation domain-containing protein [Congregibacter sp.]|jgi:prepilin-type N-terminal cleavage/methylation domain-containing protein
MKKHTFGFSLIELSIVLVVMGGISLFLAKMFPQISTLLDLEANDTSITMSSDALLGFVVANHRLPCPDDNNDGVENCATSVQTGNLPYRTLGFSRPVSNANGQLIHYAVHRNSPVRDLATDTLTDHYEPLLPNGEVSSQLNGLDFCYALRESTKSAFSPATPFIGSMNSAFILVDPGTENADGIGSLFDGINATGLGFELTIRKNELSYDDRVYSMGFTELAGRLQCAQQMAAVNGAAREAFAADDMKLVAGFYVRYREFAVEVNQANLDRAIFNRDTAAAMVAINGANLLVNVVVAFQTAGISAPFTLAAITAATTASASALALAAISVETTTESLAESNVLKTAADVRLSELTAYASSSVIFAKSIDEKGLF